MTNVTFSIDDDVHKRMKEHPEIKWTEILRKSIIDYLKKVEETDVIPIDEFRKNLAPDTLKMINDLKEDEELLFYQKAKEMENKRLQTQQELEGS